jgi:signal recognition particle subunit SRP54
MSDELSEMREAAFARRRGRGVLTEADIKEGLREVRRVLLEADVSFDLTRDFLERVQTRAVGLTALSPPSWITAMRSSGMRYAARSTNSRASS